MTGKSAEGGRAACPAVAARVSTSVVLDDLLEGAPSEHVTLGWLGGRLGDRSFGVVLLLLALLGLLPGVSAVAGVLLMVPAVQMVLGRPGPVLPRRVAARRFETERLARVVRRVVPVLRFLERFIRPRWATPSDLDFRVDDHPDRLVELRRLRGVARTQSVHLRPFLSALAEVMRGARR